MAYNTAPKYKSNTRYSNISVYSAKSYTNPIAQSYFNKISGAGGDVIDKININAFVNQLSQIIDPSLWVAWPMRSTQNIGTGTTVYSLGGLANLNGTLINGPIWNIDGILFAASPSLNAMTVNMTVPPVAYSVIVVTKAATVSTGIYQAWDATGGGLNGPWLGTNPSTADRLQAEGFRGGSAGVAFLQPIFTNVRCSLMSSASLSTNINLSYINNSSSQSAEAALIGSGNFTSSSSLRFGGRNGITVNNENEISFALVSNSDLRLYHTQINNIYKNTIGQNLGL